MSDLTGMGSAALCASASSTFIMPSMATNLYPRETVILAEDFSAMVAWYRDVLGFQVAQMFKDDFHFANLETESGIKIGIAAAQEMGVVPGERKNNTVVLQFQVDDVKAFFGHLERHGDTIEGGPSYDEKLNFWFGSFADVEGNSIWVVDKNCP